MKGKAKYIKKAYSKDTLRNFTFNKDNATVYPDFSLQAAYSIIQNDPVARGAWVAYMDKFMEGEMNFLKKDTGDKDSAFELSLQEKYMFRQLIRNVAGQGKLFNQAFFEIVQTTDNKTKSLNVLDTQNIEPITKPNGDPIGFKSTQSHPDTGGFPTWTTEEIVWIRFNDISKGYAPVDLRAVYENLLAKEYVTRYVSWLWKTGQYRLIYSFDGAADQDITDFLTYAKKHDNNFQAPFAVKGKLETSILRDIKETDSLVELLKYYDSQTLILMRMPPIDAGIPDASGRSNADAQSNNLSSHITSMKKVIEDAINFDLFPKINKKNNLMKFAPNDRFAVKQVFENLQLLDSLGATRNFMEQYLNDTGMYYEGEMFEKRVDPMAMGNGDNPRDADSAPSRIGKGEGEAEKKIGTGSQSTTRENQL